MPISTDLKNSPYFDDYNEEKDFYRVLFKPSYAVQTRELNQLQTILQKQVERFGDNIFKSGTIIDGCNFTQHPDLPYIKIRDFQADGLAAVPESYKGLYVKNSANLVAYVVEGFDGFEAASPDLNTLYLRYLNSGNTLNDSAFSANQILTVYDPLSPIFSVAVSNGSAGFSNSDILITTPTIEISNSTGGTGFANGFYVGDYITNGLGANVQITEITDLNNKKYITYKPSANNLALGNTVTWTIDVDNAIVNSNTAEHATVKSIVGSGFSGKLTTDTVGKISYVTVTNSGEGYDIPPFISVYSTTANTTQIATANLVSANYKAKITVANNSLDPVGFGYGVSVSSGVVYQKGYFLRVAEQLCIVSKYSAPDNVVLGFATGEEIIDSNDDTSLLDNTQGSNDTAPGADRLKLVPYLSVLTKKEASANSEFLTLIEYTNGSPYKQSSKTQYNIIEQAMAQRTAEEAGNFVLDNFIATTISDSNIANENTFFRSVVDTGIAYINGYRVETKEKFYGPVNKGLYENLTSGSISTNFGNYVRAKNVGGHLPFSGNEVVELHSALSSWNGTGTMTSPGSIIGYARLRGISAEDQSAGYYNLYLYDVRMSAGKNFSAVKSIYYSGTEKGYAELILESSTARIKDSNYNGLLFRVGLDAIKQIDNVTYQYRTKFEDLTANSTGFITKTLSGTETFPYVGTLSSADELDIIVIPRADITATSNVSGSIAVTSGSNTATGTGTSFLTELTVNDWIKVANSTANTTLKVSGIANNTSLSFANNAGTTITGNVAYFYPNNSIINMQNSVRTANVSANSKMLTISLGSSINSANVDVIASVKVANTTPGSKTVNRSLYARLDMSNNVSGISGPWNLGVADIFRLRGVYLGSNNTFLKSDTGITDVTNSFYIDHNQTVDLLNHGYLIKKPGSSQSITTGSRLLVEFDAFTGSDDIYYRNSYVTTDNVAYANLSTTINTMEIPEVWSSKDEYYDLRDCIDIRPRAAATATITSSQASATINPAVPSMANLLSATAKKFPAPDGSISFDVTYYTGRKDLVAIDETGTINIIEGEKDGTLPPRPKNSMLIDKLDIPPYPSIPALVSGEFAKIIDTKVANEKYSNKRASKFKVKSLLTSLDKAEEQPKVYTMEDIGAIDRRLSDVEYYVSFTLQETFAKNRSLTSQADENAERFKFGYFVDPYDDDRYSDQENPAFKAEFRSSRLVPFSDKNNIKLKIQTADTTSSRILPAYEEYMIVNQPYATKLTPAGTVTTVNQKTVSQIVSWRSTATDIYGRVSEVSEFTMSSKVGTVEMYFNFRDNKNAIEIYQGTSPNFSIAGLTPVTTAVNRQAWTTYDRYYKAADIIVDKFETDTDTEWLGSPAKLAVEDTGKLIFNHDPANGQYYKIVITKYKKSGGADKWHGKFYYKLFYPSDYSDTVSVPSTVTVINTTTGETSTNVVKTGDVPSTGVVNSFTYNGTMIINSNLISLGRYSGILGARAGAIYGGQTVTVQISGMKPNTKHKFYVDDTDTTTSCFQNGVYAASTLTSDSEGKINFTYYHRSTDLINSTYTRRNILDYYSTEQTFRVVVKTDDNSSIARGTLKAKK